MLELNESIEMLYLVTGVAVAVAILMSLRMLKSEGPDLLKSRIFLKFDTLVKAAYVSSAAAVFYVIANIAHYLDVDVFLHNLGEIVFNLGIIISITIVYHALKKKG
jgi:hypothetical protein